MWVVVIVGAYGCACVCLQLHQGDARPTKASRGATQVAARNRGENVGRCTAETVKAKTRVSSPVLNTSFTQHARTYRCLHHKFPSNSSSWLPHSHPSLLAVLQRRGWWDFVHGVCRRGRGCCCFVTWRRLRSTVRRHACFPRRCNRGSALGLTLTEALLLLLTLAVCGAELEPQQC